MSKVFHGYTCNELANEVQNILFDSCINCNIALAAQCMHKDYPNALDFKLGLMIALGQPLMNIIRVLELMLVIKCPSKNNEIGGVHGVDISHTGKS